MPTYSTCPFDPVRPLFSRPVGTAINNKPQTNAHMCGGRKPERKKHVTVNETPPEGKKP